MKWFRKINEKYWREAIAADFVWMWLEAQMDSDFETSDTLEYIIDTIKQRETTTEIF